MTGSWLETGGENARELLAVARCAVRAHGHAYDQRDGIATVSGWVMLVGLGAAAAVGLWVAGVARSLWTMVGAALMIGAAGYAAQEHAGLAGHPVQADRDAVAVFPDMTEMRDQMLGRFTGDGAYLIASDALMRSGSRESGARVVLMGANRYPRSLTLWTGLGTAISQHDGGAVSPAARLAFEQAMRLAPEHPAPPFFAGLAYVQSGDFRKGRAYWLRALALSPRGTPYREGIALRLAALDAMIAQMPPG
ncbi:hypothetical protein [Sphingomonas sp. CARO-RG-8B-R24-01]|uniref:tetratricopeptide repeat protein n=1 Tax=Sphingomonas sp. CARO-RG-8B-R24-01 TaxID=2914831 RepID=UPI001F55F9A2|nr:hypothetical protein [Sphingomonas sp. CARO-RG-8B-R24-01]